MSTSAITELEARAVKAEANRRWVLAKVDRDLPVPCGNCTACCRTTAVILYPEVGDDPTLYQTTEILDPYWGGRREMLARRADGACVYLDDERGCTIHDQRPRACRSYSCIEQYELYTRRDRRMLKRTGKWTKVHEAGERQYKLRAAGAAT